MEVAVYKNFFALRPIRCVSKVPNSMQYAGGAGFTLGQALARCESEVIERDFHLNELVPAKIRPLGIAAHLGAKQARERALQECVESLCLKQIHSEGQISCRFIIKLFGITLGIARTSHGYFALLRGNLSGVPIAAHSAAAGFFSTWAKVWEEFQSLYFFRPQGTQLRFFTKANQLFSELVLRNLNFKFVSHSCYSPDLSSLQERVIHRNSRVIVYYCET